MSAQRRRESEGNQRVESDRGSSIDETMRGLKHELNDLATATHDGSSFYKTMRGLKLSVVLCFALVGWLIVLQDDERIET